VHVRPASTAASATTRPDASGARLFPGAVSRGLGGWDTSRDTAGRKQWGVVALSASDNDGQGRVNEALNTVNALIAKRQKSATRFQLVPKDEAMEQAIKILKASNPTPNPGEWNSQDKTSQLADGQWEVLYAPHMFILQKVLFTEFAPRYILGSANGQNTILSNVRYQSALFGAGWLNAAGTYYSVDADTVGINFERFWWDHDVDQPSADTGKVGPGLVQTLGKAGFIPAFSRFPVGYVDERLCEFQFQASGTSILAVKVSPAP